LAKLAARAKGVVLCRGRRLRQAARNGEPAVEKEGEMLRKSIRIACLAATLVLATLVLGVGATADQAPVAPGADDLSIGPGATLMTVAGSTDGQDSATGSAAEQFGFFLKARTADRSLVMGLQGPAISLCSVHGPGAFVDFASESGNSPMQDMQCGRAFGMDVALDGCSANLEYHGFVHSDRSSRIYFGSMTADVVFRKTGDNTGTMRLTIFTPKAPMLFRGTVQSPTPIVMTTCS
jgi:hypothetical protein